MAKQLTIGFSGCTECGNTFPTDALNHWNLCEECAEDLEIRADLQAEHVDRKLSELPSDCKGSYEWELIRQREYNGWTPETE